MRPNPLALVSLAYVSWLITAGGAAQAPANSDLNYDQSVTAALTAFRAGDFPKARELFERAHRLNPNARTLRALGLTAVELERYTEAREELEAARHDARNPLTPAQREEVGNMLKWLQDTFAMLQLQVEPAQAQASVDGVPIHGVAVLEPGQHTIHITADGYRALDRTLTLNAGTHRSLEFALEKLDLSPQPMAASLPDAEPADSPFVQPGSATPAQTDAEPITSRWWFWTAVGVVVVAGATTAVVMSTSKKNSPVPPPGKDVEVLTLGPRW